MSCTWRQIRPTARGASIPPLLIKYQFGSNNYQVYLTDLTTIWSESLEQSEILQRAKEIVSSITPSDHDQRVVLFRHIQHVLEQQKGTTLSLSRGDGEEDLVLHLLHPLIEGLQPLRWPVRLDPQPQNVFTNQFLLPCLNQQLNTNAQVSSLLRHLQDKDHVIGKLTDKMRSEGIELGKLFPASISARPGRQLDRESVGQTVPGLSTFSKRQWQRQCIEELQHPNDLSQLISKTFDSVFSVPFKPLQIPKSFKWWEQIGRQSQEVGNGGKASFSRNVNSQFSAEDDFQTQSTPERLKNPAPRAGNVALGGQGNQDPSLPIRELEESTTDESDDGLRSKRPQKPKSPQSSSRSLDKVIQPQEGEEEEAKAGNDSSSTGSPTLTPLHENGIPTKLKARIGRIGGATSTDYAPRSRNSGDGPRSPSANSDGTTNLVRVFKTTPTESKEPRTLSNQRLRTPPRETSQERADRKREQLKRDLDESKSHQKSRKKRRF
ncbi:MAG: hypothetical protein Q9214_000858 [Letrouitia sp. 1 TL-2023]